jgi:hypothetical protein
MRLFVTIVFLILTQYTFANRIDSLKTDADVLSFLRTVSKDFTDQGLSTVTIPIRDSLLKNYNCDAYFEKWERPVWETTDLDQDNRNDLIVTIHNQTTSQYLMVVGYCTYIVMDKGQDKFQLITFDGNIFSGCGMVKPISVGQQQLLLLYHQINIGKKKVRSFGDVNHIRKVDTMVYKFGTFIEWNANAGHKTIDELSFQTWGCYGSCPIFEMILDKKGVAQYNAIRYNGEDHGLLHAVIGSNRMEEIHELLNYIDFDKSYKDYRVPWTDAAGCSLEIKFTGEPRVKISDYGMAGTYGLMRLYKLLTELRSSQDWKY